MKPNKFISFCTLFLFSCTAVYLTACTETTIRNESDESEYQVTSNRPSSQVTVSNEANNAIVEIYSDNGIGSASVKLVNGDWPESIVMHFHLQGLESLQFSYGDTIIDLSVNTQNIILQIVKFADGTNEAIDEESDFWLPVTFLDSEGATEDGPTAGGIIVVNAPADFHYENPSEFTINWIDFYR
jgi:hypothetical protein